MEPVTIVVPCKDDPLIFDMACSIDYPAVEVLVVFNGSTESFREAVTRRLETLAREVRVISLHDANLAGALELGTREARYDLVLYMDSDCLFAPGAIGRFIEAAERGDAGQSVFKGEVSFDAGKSFLTKIIARTRTHHTAEVLTAYKPPLLISKQILPLVGGYAFDERLLWREDSDFDCRIRRAGIEIVAVEGGVILHKPLGLKTDLRSTFRYGVGLARAKRLQVELTEVPRSVASTWRSKGLAAAAYMLVRNRVYDAGVVYGWLSFRKEGRR